MESILNLAWVLLAATMLCLWLHLGRRMGPVRQMHNRPLQFVALALLLLILFPVISVTDDLQVIQSAAEVSSSHRRHQVCTSAHSILPATAAPPPATFAGLSFGYLHLAASGRSLAMIVVKAASGPIQNRPPPIA